MVVRLGVVTPQAHRHRLGFFHSWRHNWLTKSRERKRVSPTLSCTCFTLHLVAISEFIYTLQPIKRSLFNSLPLSHLLPFQQRYSHHFHLLPFITFTLLFPPFLLSLPPQKLPFLCHPTINKPLENTEHGMGIIESLFLMLIRRTQNEKAVRD